MKYLFTLAICFFASQASAINYFSTEYVVPMHSSLLMFLLLEPISLLIYYAYSIRYRYLKTTNKKVFIYVNLATIALVALIGSIHASIINIVSQAFLINVVVMCNFAIICKFKKKNTKIRPRFYF